MTPRRVGSERYSGENRRGRPIRSKRSKENYLEKKQQQVNWSGDKNSLGDGETQGTKISTLRGDSGGLQKIRKTMGK